ADEMQSSVKARQGKMWDLKVFACTWNVGNSEPIDEKQLQNLLGWQSGVRSDIYIIGLQEISTGPVETAISFISHDVWAKSFLDFFSKQEYFMVENVRLQGMSLCVFASIQHLPFIRFVKASYERTGFSGNWGNKGGVAISFWCYGEKIAVLNTHLHANLEVCEKRIIDFEKILKGIDFNETCDILSHDVVLWIGDTNFRIDDVSRSDVIKLVQEKKYKTLLKKDQLIKNQRSHNLLSQFIEGEINFAPTYKFDLGTDIYDTSVKQRKPAWTDRVLYRVHPDKVTLRKGKSEEKFVQQIVGSYVSHMEMQTSDHKPVTSIFRFHFTKDVSPIVNVQVGEISKDFVEVEITFEPGMFVDFHDYVALYPENLGDFRSYITWVYVPGSDAAENFRIRRKVSAKLPIQGPSVGYRVGYYSVKFGSLANISRVFNI
uniref:Inositol polyphosphate-related phosphatase domain-containing protein n=1 Tax=Ciona intestinalis TaxID=7719 RepID=H2XMJ7_CIOIN